MLKLVGKQITCFGDRLVSFPLLRALLVSSHVHSTFKTLTAPIEACENSCRVFYSFDLRYIEIPYKYEWKEISSSERPDRERRRCCCGAGKDC